MVNRQNSGDKTAVTKIAELRIADHEIAGRQNSDNQKKRNNLIKHFLR
jgi:hypothetical protein